MHEVALAESAVRLIEDAARRDGFSRVHRIRMEIGALSCVDPEALRFALESATRGGCAQGSTLDFSLVDGEGECPDCGARAPMTEPWALCPDCGNRALRVVSGDRMRIVELDVE